MGLQVGTRFGAFEIQSLLGVGGMGEVYRARDTRLGRDVALKIIPTAVAADRDRLERFDREARALATLNHPSIAAIYDVAEVDGTRALVLELVDGETLQQRLERGPLVLDEALKIARAIAAALDTAHDRGLVHRDLKPANIKLTPGGDVKLLDFGVAKMLAVEDGSTTPTVTGTLPGAIVGTAAYMSPEQARGQAVDKRADVWAFGCVLFEMLTGRAAFLGPTWSDSIARTLSGEPDWAALPPATPHRVTHLIERCLQKDARERLRGLGGVELAFESRRDAGSVKGRPWLQAVAGGAIIVATAAVAWSVWNASRRGTAADAATVQFEILLPVGIAENGSFALSPDGAKLAFVAPGTDGRLRLWERAFDSLEVRPISGSEGELAPNTTMFWSPDSRFIGFYADGAVRRIDRQGGQPAIVCRVPGVAVGGTWSRDNEIVVGAIPGGLVRCPAAGGAPTPVTMATSSGGAAQGTVHLFPSFLPDGRRLLYFRVSRADPSASGLYVADLDRAPDAQSESRIVETGFIGRFAPTEDGHGRLLFVRNRALWAAPFDTTRLAVNGEAVEVAPSVGTFRDFAYFDTNGPVLVYRSGEPDYQLAWRNRKGANLGEAGEPGRYQGVALSPDVKHAAVARENRLDRANQDLWIIDLQRNTTSRFTSDPFPKSVPAWSSDGRAIFYVVGHDSSDIRRRSVEGDNEQAVLPGGTLKAVAINPLLTTINASADGAWLTFGVDTRGASRSDVWVLSLRGPFVASPLIEQPFDQVQPAISPDMRWLAYVSDEAGANEIYLRSLSQDGGKLTARGNPIPVSRGGGQAPRWRADSGELFYQSLTGGIMTARVTAGGIGEPAQLFAAPGALAEWGVAPDGQRFLLALPAEDQRSPFRVVLNWIGAR